jgi:hypothetical protein
VIRTYKTATGSVIIDEKTDISDETCQVESALSAGFSTFAEN